MEMGDGRATDKKKYGFVVKQKLEQKIHFYIILKRLTISLFYQPFMYCTSTRKLVFAVVALSLYPLIRQLID